MRTFHDNGKPWVYLIAVLTVLFLVGCGPENNTDRGRPPTKTPKVQVTSTIPGPLVTVPPVVETRVPTVAPVPSRVPTSPPTAVIPEPVPSGVPTRAIVSMSEPNRPAPCRGGSDKDRPRPTCTPTPVPPPTNTPEVVPTDTPVVIPTSPPGVVEAMEADVLGLINEYRAKNGLVTLARFESLTLAAREWSRFMVETDDCRHGEGEDHFALRAQRHGYTGFAFGENGACGYPNDEELVQGWKDSPGHNGILLADRPFDVLMTDGGVGCAQYANGYWNCFFIIGGG